MSHDTHAPHGSSIFNVGRRTAWAQPSSPLIPSSSRHGLRITASARDTWLPCLQRIYAGSHLPCHWRLSASFHIQKGENKQSAVKSSDVTCTNRLSRNSWKYSVHEAPPANAACKQVRPGRLSSGYSTAQGCMLAALPPCSLAGLLITNVRLRQAQDLRWLQFRTGLLASVLGSRPQRR